MTSRRTILIAAAVFGGAWALGPTIRRAFRPEFVFEDIPDLPGFVQLVAGEVTGASTPFAGLNETAAIATDEVIDDLTSDLCNAVHDARTPGDVPVAVFTDYNCPFCRTLNEDIQRLSRRDPPLSVTWHEWPRIAPSSEPAARAALAAHKQGAYIAFHRRLMRTRFQPNDAYLRELAQSVEIDADMLLQDMASPDVDAALTRAAGLAALFRLPGTPAMIIGRRLIIGRVSAEELQDLVALERNAPSGCEIGRS